MRQFRYILILFGAILFNSLSAMTTFPKYLSMSDSSVYYCAHEVGMELTYHQRGREDYCERVVAVRDDQNNKYVTFAVQRCAARSQFYELKLSKFGIHCLDPRNHDDEPLPRWLALPFCPGKKWENTFGEGVIETENRIEVGVETVEVPVGTFKAIRVEVRQQMPHSPVLVKESKHTLWFARDVGIIKLVNDDDTDHACMLCHIRLVISK